MRPDRHPSPHPFPRRDPAGLERLRERVRALEGWAARHGDAHARATVSLGATDIDAGLPWGGLGRGALHEVFAAGPGDAGAATGFCAALAARLLREAGRDGGAVLWCEGVRTLDAGGLYAPGLARFELDPARLIVARTRRDADALWAMEEGLRAHAVAAVVGEVAALSLTASRRLQLAAEAGGVTALALRPHAPAPAASAAATRWRVGGLNGAGNEPGLGPARWRAELFRCRGGGAQTWEMEWRDQTSGVLVAAPLRDRPAMPDTARMAG